MSSEDEGFKQRLNPFGSAIGAKPTFKAAEYADLESNNAQLRAQLSALEAENARLREDIAELKSESFEGLYNAVIDERDAALAQLAGIQQAKGEVMPPDITTGRGYPAYSVEAVQRITAAMAAEVERLRASAEEWGRNTARVCAERDALRAELAAVKGGRIAGWLNPDARDEYMAFVFEKDDTCDNWQPLYTAPPASPDVEGLVKALEKLACLGNGDRPGNSVGNQIAQDALSTWRKENA